QRVHTIRNLRRERNTSPADAGPADTSPGGRTGLIAADQHATGTRRTMHHLGYTPEELHDFQHNAATTAQHPAQPGQPDADDEQQCA
ncbi:hypothetical protein, partial [Zhihengliuella salsuginis]|uniref:hypothetical protein n=1 Tax=Zhihengliuella salsuginis TaxID=578222 RepID=UPI001673493A